MRGLANTSRLSVKIAIIIKLSPSSIQRVAFVAPLIWCELKLTVDTNPGGPAEVLSCDPTSTDQDDLLRVPSSLT